MKESRKEFILQAHNEACTDWKTKIEKEFPKLFKETELVVGKWYKKTAMGSKYLMVWNGGDITYGFFDGRYGSDWGFCAIAGATPATDKEVETALINEAKKRGFKEGVRFDNAYETRLYEKGSGLVNKIAFHKWRGLSSGNQWVFFEGKWATIIEQKTDLTVAQIEDKLGYSVNVVKG